LLTTMIELDDRCIMREGARDEYLCYAEQSKLS
jgi:hypothetical protein